MLIYLIKDGQQVGPYEAVQVKKLITDGFVSEDTLAWRDGIPNWTSLSEILSDRIGIGSIPIDSSSRSGTTSVFYSIGTFIYYCFWLLLLVLWIGCAVLGMIGIPVGWVLLSAVSICALVFSFLGSFLKGLFSKDEN